VAVADAELGGGLGHDLQVILDRQQGGKPEASAAGVTGSDRAAEAGQPLAESQQTGPASGGSRRA
jgi:hypothetical protein